MLCLKFRSWGILKYCGGFQNVFLWCVQSWADTCTGLAGHQSHCVLGQQPLAKTCGDRSPSWGSQATSQRHWTGKSLCTTMVMPQCRHRQNREKTPSPSCQGWPELGEPGKQAGSCLLEKSCKGRSIAQLHLEGAPVTQLRQPQWLSQLLTQAFLCRSACWGRQEQSSILASLIFQGSLKPGQNLFATGRRMQHADAVISTGQASHTAENYFLRVKNIPVGWNKQN